MRTRASIGCASPMRCGRSSSTSGPLILRFSLDRWRPPRLARRARCRHAATAAAAGIRRRRSPGRLHSTSCLLGMGGSSLAPEVLRQVLGIRGFGPIVPHARLRRSRRGSRRHGSCRDVALRSRQQIGLDDRADVDGRRSAASRDRVGPYAVGVAIRRDHRRRHGVASACDRRRIPRGLRESRRISAAATRRSRSSAWSRQR